MQTTDSVLLPPSNNWLPFLGDPIALSFKLSFTLKAFNFALIVVRLSIKESIFGLDFNEVYRSLQPRVQQL